jgi:hypothetical protein
MHDLHDTVTENVNDARMQLDLHHFEVLQKGDSAADAFTRARTHALAWYGTAGYPRTIAETQGFVTLPVPAGVEPRAFVAWLRDDLPIPATHQDYVGRSRALALDAACEDAACVELASGLFFFFG